jgi:cytochrome c-type biogenesis protein CcmE
MPKELKDAMAKAHQGKRIDESASQDKPQL